MNVVAMKKTLRIRSSYTTDSTENIDLDPRMIRMKEKQGVVLFSAVQQIMTVKGMRENQYYMIYGTKHARNRFDECGRVSLTSRNRTG